MKKNLPVRGILLVWTLISMTFPTLTGQTFTGLWSDYASGSINGSGTTQTPYQISSAGDLAWLARQVGEGQTFENTYFELTGDIDLTGHLWVPIGHGMVPNNFVPFQGIFNGAGWTISNLRIEGNELPGDYYHTGLFGVVGGGCRIQDLILESPFVQGKDNENPDCFSLGTAILAGYVYNHTAAGVQFSGCHIKSPTLEKSTTNSSSLFSGGFIGRTVSTMASSYITELSDCHIEGGIITGGNSKSSNGTGGLAGENNGTLKISNSTNSSMVIGGISNQQHTGGL